MPSERELIQRAKAGEQESFAALVSAYETKIYYLAFRYLNDREDAMDAVQEVFLRVYRFLSGFQEGSEFSTWVYRIAVNVCKDMLSQRTRRQAISLESWGEEEEGPLELPDDRYRPERLTEEKERRRLLSRAIRELPDSQREILLLRDVHGLSYEEIGKALELEPGTVKSRLFRARNLLRKKLLQNGNIFGFSLSKEIEGGDADESL